MEEEGERKAKTRGVGTEIESYDYRNQSCTKMRGINRKNHKLKQSKYKTRIWYVKEISDKKNCKNHKNL